MGGGNGSGGGGVLGRMKGVEKDDVVLDVAIDDS